MKNEMYQEMLAVTKELVSIPSVNGTPGERNIAEHVAKMLRALTYFSAHPENIIVQELINDPYGRLNVIGIVRGEKDRNPNTILLHGHIDTVGIEDYGSIMDCACDCDALPMKIKEITKDEDVLRDIASGDWLFGRGVSDMKSGVALNFVLTKYYAERVKDLSGNIIFMANPVEENQHTGIMNSLEVFETLKEKEHFNYRMAINTDFISPAYPGDTTHYFHAGAVGKILPCFYIIGKPTHSGQGFEGFSASMAAAEIVRQMDLSMAFSDCYNNEYTMPPTALKIKDLKPTYNVQTTFSAFVYFNYFIHNESMDNIMARLKKVSEEALTRVMEYTNEQFKTYCALTDFPYQKIEYPLTVLEYRELYEMAKEKYDGDLETVIAEIREREMAKVTDMREITRMITETLCIITNINTPTVVVFIAPPFCPRNTLKLDVPEEKALLDEMKALLAEKAKEDGLDYKMMQFFPVLTDSSYLKIDDDPRSLECLINNFPDFRNLYPVPIEAIKRLNIPAFNFGCLGKDAHKWTERLYLPYSFGTLPGIIQTVIDKYLPL